MQTCSFRVVRVLGYIDLLMHSAIRVFAIRLVIYDYYWIDVLSYSLR